MKRIEYKVVVDEDGNKYWYLNDNDKRHREDGPAIEYANGTNYWYINDDLHREDGPAVEYADGSKFWYLNGRRVSEAEIMENQQTIDIDGKKFTLAQIKAALAKA